MAVETLDAPGVTESQIAEWPFYFEIVPLDRFMVDESYQRKLTSLAEEIATQFNPALIGTVVGSLRKNGKIALVDGQTRFRGSEKSGKVTSLPAVVFTGLSRQDEAALFALLQRKRRNMATHERFKAAMVARDPETVGIDKILKKYGLAVGSRGQTDDGRTAIQSVAALESVYRRDPLLLGRVIFILSEAWKGRGDFPPAEGFSADLIRGVAAFIAKSKSGIDDERLIDRMSKTTPAAMQIRAGMLRQGKGGGGNTSAYMAETVLNAYSARK